ncbi:MAG: hypothetical protein E7157_04275 [Lactobacillales bacterium]|nr:hypothetical protein [Lactobacillales bacterium]
MTEQEFYKLYWNPYKQIEDEFIETFKYVDFSENNYNVYSSKFLKLILQIGSEIDICLKLYVNMLHSGSYNNINEYRNIIEEYDNELVEEKVLIKNFEVNLQPWLGLTNENNDVIWWKIYNSIKHDRTKEVSINGINQKAYMFATLYNVLISLGGLYVVLMNIFSNVKNSRDDSPLPNSKIFKLISDRWSNCRWYSIGYVSIGADGYLYMDNTKEFWF